MIEDEPEEGEAEEEEEPEPSVAAAEQAPADGEEKPPEPEKQLSKKELKVRLARVVSGGDSSCVCGLVFRWLTRSIRTRVAMRRIFIPESESV